MAAIDLNSDLGEACGDDAAMLQLVSTASIACGYHAGDPQMMASTLTQAKQSGVAVGAHPSYPDREGFGRRPMALSEREIERIVAYQIGAAQAMAALVGHRITHVKIHGALANRAAAERSAADAIARAIRSVDRDLVFLAIALSHQVGAAENAGLRAATEIFADRGYDENGQLIVRGTPGAMIEDPVVAVQRALTMIDEQCIVAASGRKLATPVDSICIHGDTPHAVQFARALREKLIAAGVEIRPFAAR